MTSRLDLIIPVYNEGENILPVLRSIEKNVKTPVKVLICYDMDDDNTLPVIKNNSFSIPVEPVKNFVKRGPHGAVVSGFRASTAAGVLVFPADDTFNAAIIDSMVARQNEGADLVCASRFIPGGCMEGCPFIKFWLVRISSFCLRYLAFLPVHDATNGFRLFSRKVIDQIEIESDIGFTYSIELLVKTHRLGWKILEVPAKWFQRKAGESRFRVFQWLGPYLYWFFYGFSTTYLIRGPGTVRLRSPDSKKNQDSAGALPSKTYKETHP